MQANLIQMNTYIYSIIFVLDDCSEKKEKKNIFYKKKKSNMAADIDVKKMLNPIQLLFSHHLVRIKF